MYRYRSASIDLPAVAMAVVALLVTMSFGCDAETTDPADVDADIAADADVGADTETDHDAADVDEPVECPEDFASLEDDCRCVGQAEACLRDAEECDASLDPDELGCEPGAMLWHVHYKHGENSFPPSFATSKDGFLYVVVGGGQSFTDSDGREIALEGEDEVTDQYNLVVFDPRGRFSWKARLLASEPSLEIRLRHVSATDAGVRLVLEASWTDLPAGELVLTRDSDEHRLSGELSSVKNVVAEMGSDGQVHRFDAAPVVEPDPDYWISCHGFPPGEDQFTEVYVPISRRAMKSHSPFTADGSCYATMDFMNVAGVDGQEIIGELSNFYESLMVGVSADAEADWIRRVYGTHDISPRGAGHVAGDPVALYNHAGQNRDLVVESTDGETGYASTPGSFSVIKWDSQGELQWTKILATDLAPERLRPRPFAMDTDGERIAIVGRFEDNLSVFRQGAFYPNLLKEDGIHSFLGLMDADGEFLWSATAPPFNHAWVKLSGRSAVVMGRIDDPIELDGQTYGEGGIGERYDLVFMRFATD